MIKPGISRVVTQTFHGCLQMKISVMGARAQIFWVEKTLKED